VNWGNFGQLG